MVRMPTYLTTEFDELIESGNMAAARELLRNHIASGSIEALFLSSTLSQPDENTDDFERRSLQEVEAAALNRYAPAMYRLGCYYRFGDFVEVDITRAAGYFESAAKAGLPAAMYEYGLALLHGGAIRQERDEALYWIRKAADCGDETAKGFLLT